jgi:hypothetical protein
MDMKIALPVQAEARWLSLLLVDVIALLAFLLSTNPATLPLPLLLIPFVLVYVALWIGFFIVLLTAPPTKDLRIRTRRIISSLMSLLPFSLLVFQSLHQLSFKDVLLAGALVLGLGFYVSRADYLR